MYKELNRFLDEHIASAQKFRASLPDLENIINAVNNTFKSGGKLLICGNGGSAADAQHMAAEFIVRFKINRHAMPAVALTTDSSILTAGGNDLGFDEIFSRQVEAIGSSDDMLIMFSTSGNSRNLLLAAETAAKKNIYTLAFLGKTGGELKDKVNKSIIVQSHDTARIQEMHSFIMHCICEITEKEASGA